jgi:hypothetical protein
VAPRSMFDNAEATCAWEEADADDAGEASCVYREVEFTVRVSE